MTTQEIIEALRAHRPMLEEKSSIQDLAVFGSAVRGAAGPRSDVDILVEFDPDAHIGLFEFARLRELLGQLLGRPVDLATPDALHPALKDRILKEAVRAA
ncbi:MAG: nucleotidyltransferase family protein [Deltaproteobacteria bacterium]|nr:nucleotidyltransferase family protein [Deltaproteobacteria bacterium]